MRAWPWLIAGLIAGLLAGSAAQAQGTAVAPTGERLSDWLLRHPPGAATDPLGLQWQRQSEVAAQRRQRDALIDALRAATQAGRVRGEDAERLIRALEALPVTGRVALPLRDPRLLQAHPELDPVLAAGDHVVLAQRSNMVAVWLGDAPPCVLRFEPLWPAARYLAACGSKADRAWIIEPDASVIEVGVAPWNASTQDLPAPGARIWAPGPGWPRALSERFAAFLATQAPVDATLPTDRTVAPADLAQRAAALPRDLVTGPSDWGVTGLLQTPTARFAPAGRVGFSYSQERPYHQYNFDLSPFDALEVVVRYTAITNQPYGVVGSGQSYLDKSIEAKLALTDETRWLPALALGLRDPGGTGLFAGEYLVGSKRWGDLDFSLGLGWGYLGARGNLRNPFAALGSRWQTRTAPTVGQGGEVSLKTLFTGRTAVFGGVQWSPRGVPWQLQLELDGNDYRREPFGQRLRASSPVNLGWTWQSGPLGVRLGFERGRILTFGLNLQTDLPRLDQPKIALPRLAPADPSRPPSGADARTLADASAQTGWDATRIELSQTGLGPTWTVTVDAIGGEQQRQRIDRGNAVLDRDAPPEIRAFEWVLRVEGTEVARRLDDRGAWVAAHTRWTGMPAPLPAAAEPAPPPQRELVATPSRAAAGNAYLGFQQQLGGPDGYLYALSAGVAGRLDIARGTWLQGSAELRLIDNYDKFTYTADSSLPRVRTHVREYLTDSRLNLPNAQITNFERLGDSVYSLVYAGWLEPMYAGVGGELMWRPQRSGVALGLDLNHVRQRHFDQHLGLRDYAVNTGHLTLYWDTGWQGVRTAVSAGQYLAGDRGVTVDLSRGFANGTRIGLWATKTNVSAAAFGEGSFDKGFYVSIPFDVLFSVWSKETMKIVWQPLIRDGGAKLDRAVALWGLTAPGAH